ncbi:MAG TPA: HIT domain-containing protein [Blastocatellia bacterium]|nr:HIT domain-containing protein [Blastocatellia bacterium]
MEFLWSPWRYQYISKAEHEPGCVFCRAPQLGDDQASLIVYRGKLVYAILNLFPYTSGHLMIVPYQHTDSFVSLLEDTTLEMFTVAKQAQTAIESEYHPDGFNIGMNLGRAAGAGVADHIHLHIVPRWSGDANFVSIVGETRVLPEDLSTTYQRLKSRFDHRETC